MVLTLLTFRKNRLPYSGLSVSGSRTRGSYASYAHTPRSPARRRPFVTLGYNRDNYKYLGYEYVGMARENDADARTDSQKIKMARFFDEERAEYEDVDDYTLVYEDEDCAILADHGLHEINEWARRFDIDRERLRQTMRSLADQKMGEQDAHEAFSHSNPIVFDKRE